MVQDIKFMGVGAPQRCSLSVQLTVHIDQESDSQQTRTSHPQPETTDTTLSSSDFTEAKPPCVLVSFERKALYFWYL